MCIKIVLVVDKKTKQQICSEGLKDVYHALKGVIGEYDGKPDPESEEIYGEYYFDLQIISVPDEDFDKKIKKITASNLFQKKKEIPVKESYKEVYKEGSGYQKLVSIQGSIVT